MNIKATLTICDILQQCVSRHFQGSRARQTWAERHVWLDDSVERLQWAFD
jgi:hypothetical protein